MFGIGSGKFINGERTLFTTRIKTLDWATIQVSFTPSNLFTKLFGKFIQHEYMVSLRDYSGYNYVEVDSIKIFKEY